jgi:hypothetical protein
VSTWKAVHGAENPIDLLRLIRSVIHEGAGPKGEDESAVNNWIQLLCTHWSPSQTLEKFYEIFLANAGAMVAAGSKPGFDYGLWQSYIRKKRAASNIPETDRKPIAMEQEALEESWEEFLSILLIIANNTLYQPLKTHLHNKGLWDKEAWPTQQEAAYGLLHNFQPEVTRGGGQRNQAQLDGSIGLSFAEIRDMICHGCGKKGHGWRKCPELNQEQISMISEKLKAGTSAKEAIKDQGCRG